MKDHGLPPIPSTSRTRHAAHWPSPRRALQAVKGTARRKASQADLRQLWRSSFLPVPGGPNRITALVAKPKGRGGVRFDERQDDPSLDDLLSRPPCLPSTATDRTASPDHPDWPADPRPQSDMVHLLEVAQPASSVKPELCMAAVPVASRGSTALIRRIPIVRRRISSSPSSALPMPAVAPVTAQRHERYPCPLPVQCRRCHTHDLVADNGHEGRLPRSGRRDHLGNRKHGMRLTRVPTLVPDVDHPIEVVFVEIAHTPRSHTFRYRSTLSLASPKWVGRPGTQRRGAHSAVGDVGYRAADRDGFAPHRIFTLPVDGANAAGTAMSLVVVARKARARWEQRSLSQG
jgi:hypothetical protein